MGWKTGNRLRKNCIDKDNTFFRLQGMDIHYQLNGCDFVWNDRKSAGNPGKHDGVTFEQAATVFFDPLVSLGGRRAQPGGARRHHWL